MKTLRLMSFGVDINSIREQAEYFPPGELHRFGLTVVIAPHPDDESLGCGGTIALQRESGIEVHVVFVSDGSMSHPNSRKYPSNILSSLREAEAKEALAILNVAAANISFMRLKDSRLPFPGSTGFDDAVNGMRMILNGLNPDTLIVPWRRDPHADHRACWHIATSAISQLNKPVRVLEYPVWLWERGESDDLPASGEMITWKADISSVAGIKQKAISAHQSQVSKLIDDDDKGFWLSPALIAHFTVPYEIFFENTTRE